MLLGNALFQADAAVRCRSLYDTRDTLQIADTSQRQAFSHSVCVCVCVCKGTEVTCLVCVHVFVCVGFTSDFNDIYTKKQSQQRLLKMVQNNMHLFGSNN